MKESQCLLLLQRLFWTPFCLYFSARRPREILAAVRARASRDDTICSKNRNFDPYHRDKARSRAYGLLPLWIVIYPPFEQLGPVVHGHPSVDLYIKVTHTSNPTYN